MQEDEKVLDRHIAKVGIGVSERTGDVTQPRNLIIQWFLCIYVVSVAGPYVCIVLARMRPEATYITEYSALKGGSSCSRNYLITRVFPLKGQTPYYK